MSEGIEISFKPEAKEYLAAQKWLTRKAMGAIYRLNLTASLMCGLLGGMGFFMLLDASQLSGNDVLVNQGRYGFVALAGALVMSMVLKLSARKLVRSRQLHEGSRLLQHRTITMDDIGFIQRSGMDMFRTLWSEVADIEEDRHLIYLRSDPGVVFFIPKRIASADEMDRMVKFAKDMRAKSTANI